MEGSEYVMQGQKDGSKKKRNEGKKKARMDRKNEG